MSSTKPGVRPPPRSPAEKGSASPDGVLASGLALGLASGLAWLWLATSGDMSGDHMAMMTVEPWSGAYLWPAFIMWALMMVAMMLPSATPMVLLHAKLDRSPSSGHRLLHNLLFGLSYLLVWAAFSAIAAALQATLIDAGLLSAATLELGDRRLAGILLLVAAAYQLSGAKAACLDQCRSPIHFVMRYWRPGPAGALRLGVIHGLYCLGCCWALMLLLFAGGVMNLAWVAALAVIVSLEKWSPAHWRAGLIVAAALAIAGVALLVTG